MTSDRTTAPPPGPSGPRTGDSGTRWIETSSGGLFFINSILVFPYLILGVPLLTRIFVRGVVGGLQEPSTIVDTFPLLAEFLAPRYGWLAVVPLVLVVRNLRMETGRLPRAVLLAYLAAHAAALIWTLTGWAGIHGFSLPAGPPGS